MSVIHGNLHLGVQRIEVSILWNGFHKIAHNDT